MRVCVLQHMYITVYVIFNVEYYRNIRTYKIHTFNIMNKININLLSLSFLDLITKIIIIVLT